MKKRLLSLLCVLALCLGLLPGTAWAAEEVFYVAYSWNEDTSTLTSETKSVTDYTALSGSISTTTWSDGWYVVSDNATNTGRSNIKVSGTVNLILTSGNTLTLIGPNISLQDSSAVLNIYGQAGNTGKLSITAGNSSGDAGINLNGGTLNIHGGTVTATGYTTSATKSAPGIDVGTSTLTVYGGEVTAEAGTYNSAGYGAGIRVVTDGTVNIHGGTVTATGASFASANDYPGAGIGGSGSGSTGETCGTVNITGGTVTANGGGGYLQRAAAGIGGGCGNSSQGGGGNITITGGTVTATGGSSISGVQAPGIGGAVYLSSSGGAGTFSTGTNGSAVITTTGGIQDETSKNSWQGIINGTVYGTVTLPDSLKTLNKDLTVPSGATLILPDGTTTRGAITVNGTLTVDSGSTVTNTGTITVESGGTLTGTGTINNTDSGKVTGDTGNVKVTYPSTVEVSSNTSGTAVPGQEVTFTATVTGNGGTPTGSVTFKDGETTLAQNVALQDGAATYTANDGLDVGEHLITAEYIPADGSSYQGSTSSALTFTVVGEVESISIKTPPTKTEYETGNTLDLTGLEITVHYVGSTYTQNIAWGEGSGITASPANGTALTVTEHNGKTITVTYGEKTAETQALTVNKATPTVAAPTASTLTYNGTPQSLVSEGTTSGGEMQYSTEKNGNYSTAIPTGTDAGDYTVYYKVVGNDDYEGTEPAKIEVTIAKANYTGTTGVSGTVLANWSDKVTLPTIPAGASYGAASYGGKDGAVKDLSIESGVLHYTGGDNITVDQMYKITVPVDGGKNYEDYTITVTLTGTDKRVLTITGVTAQGGTYNGQTQAGYTGTPSAEGYDGGFTVTYNTADGLAPADAGTYTVTIAIPEDNAQYVGSMDLQFTIAPKALTVSVPSPSVYVGGSAPELALTYTGLVDGERVTPSEDPVFTITKSDGTVIALADAVQTAGTYTITWSNAGDTTFLDGANYAIQTETTGTLTVSARSSGGGGSSNITTEITKNPDGSTTTTVTNKNTGTVTETTTWPDGSKEVIETKKDGTVTTTTTDTAGNQTQVVQNTDGSSKTIVDNKDGSGSVTLVDENGQVVSEATLSQSAVAVAQEKGEAVALPMPEVPVTTDRETAPTVTVDLPVGGSVKVEIPVEDVTAGTVAVLVKSNGDEEIIKTSVTTENGVTVTLNDGDTVKVVDNSKTFDDVSDNYWGAEAVAFASSRELFAGTSATTFAPDTAMTRAMIVTVLARFEGVDTTAGDTWYEAGQQWAVANGVSDGTNLDGSLTREQLATMLYRYAQSAGIDTAQGGMAIREYADFEQISGYAAEAMTWAVNTGIINGTSSTTLSPQGPATRAQVATILMRFIEGMA